MALRSPSKQHDILRNGQDMTPKDRRHLRDEAGSLFAAFELGGAEELTVVSGGTAMAALVRGQSHTLSTTMPSSRDIGSYKHYLAQINCVCGDRSPSLAVTVDWNLRAPVATLCPTRLRLSPAKEGVVLHHQRTPPSTTNSIRTHILFRITHTSLSLADTPYRDKQDEIDNFLVSIITPFFRGIGLLSIYTSTFVLCRRIPGCRIRRFFRFATISLLDYCDFFFHSG
jgi:hypothetical protein